MSAIPANRVLTIGALSRVVLRPGVMVTLCSLVLGMMWASRILPLDAPDEVAHLQNIMAVRNGILLPEIHYDFSAGEGENSKPIGSPGDPSVRDYARQVGFTDEYNLIPYEAMQPPLYYLAAGLIAKLLPADPQAVLRLARLLSVLFGAATVYFCWAAVRQLAPRAPMWALASAGLIALVPQFCFNSATAANDSALNLGVAISFYLWIRALREPEFDPWMLKSGLVVGLTVLTKLTAVALLPGLAMIVLFRAFQVEQLEHPGESSSAWKARLPQLRRGIRMGAGAFLTVAAVSGWWFLRNIIVYGDPSGSRDAIRFYTGRFSLLDLRVPGDLRDFVLVTLQSALGRFSWMNRPLPSAYYSQAIIIAAALLICALFALLAASRRRRVLSQSVPAYVWQSFAALLPVAAVIVGGYLQFSLKVAWQPQARYLFPLILPAALALTGGLYALPVRTTLKVTAFGGLFVWLALVNFVGLYLVSTPH